MAERDASDADKPTKSAFILMSQMTRPRHDHPILRPLLRIPLPHPIQILLRQISCISTPSIHLAKYHIPYLFMLSILAMIFPTFLFLQNPLPLRSMLRYHCIRDHHFLTKFPRIPHCLIPLSNTPVLIPHSHIYTIMVSTITLQRRILTRSRRRPLYHTMSTASKT